MQRSREHDDIPAAGREKNAEGSKQHIYTYVQDSPSGWVLREVSGATQVATAHAGNTVVATACLWWVKQGHRSSRTGVLDYYYSLNISYLFVAFVSVAFFGLKKSGELINQSSQKDCREWSVCDVQIMIRFRPTGYSDFQSRIGFQTACENPNHNFWF